MRKIQLLQIILEAFLLLGSLYIYVNNKQGNQWEIYKLPLLPCVFFFSLGGCWCLEASSLGSASIGALLTSSSFNDGIHEIHSYFGSAGGCSYQAHHSPTLSHSHYSTTHSQNRCAHSSSAEIGTTQPLTFFFFRHPHLPWLPVPLLRPC